jgi:hypothetical protein
MEMSFTPIFCLYSIPVKTWSIIDSRTMFPSIRVHCVPLPFRITRSPYFHHHRPLVSRGPYVLAPTSLNPAAAEYLRQTAKYSRPCVWCVEGFTFLRWNITQNVRIAPAVTLGRCMVIARRFRPDFSWFSRMPAGKQMPEKYNSHRVQCSALNVEHLLQFQ